MSIEAVKALKVRETQILTLIAQGKTDVEIGLILNISRHTSRDYANKIFRLLDVHTRAQAAVWACKAGLV